jgi:1,4-dihydroxy-2-naphthoate octaprenyltransferase
MSSLSSWLQAARPRTLPLALAATGMGNLLVFNTQNFKPVLCFLSILTTLFLQVLSNFANDYGDSIHGADGKDRKGPSRMVQSGVISPHQMKAAIWVFAFLSLVSGLTLLWVSFHSDWSAFFPLLSIGLLSIAAAYFYTNGKRPYGYMALGDASVFIFFGLVAVLATAYLHTQQVRWLDFLPAISLGFWSTAVLNLNNMRDMESDKAAGKHTVPLQLGILKAKIYQTVLVFGGILSLGFFGFLSGEIYLAGSLPGILVMLNALRGVFSTKENTGLDAFLKPQALGTFIAVLGMAVSRFLLSVF